MSRAESGNDKLEKLVEDFAQNVAAQTEEVAHGSAAKGNRHAKRYLAAFDKLCAQGDAGRDALAVLFTHPRMDVRVMEQPSCCAIGPRKPRQYWRRPRRTEGWRHSKRSRS